MPRDFVATVQDSERASRIQAALGEGVEIYLTTVRPSWVAMGGQEELLYFLDLDLYTEEQREALYHAICDYQGHDPTDGEIRAIYEEVGIPLLATDVMVRVENALAYAGHPDPNMNPYSFWANLGQRGDEDDDEFDGEYPDEAYMEIEEDPY